MPGPTGEAVASGEVEIGVTQISEILPYPAIELVGPLPPDIQSTTRFSAAVAAASKEAEAAKAFIRFLGSADALAGSRRRAWSPADGSP